MRSGARVALAVTMGSAAMVSACASDPIYIPSPVDTPSVDAEELGLPADPLVLLRPGAGAGAGAERIIQRGGLSVDIELVTLDGGTVDVVQGRDGQAGFRFPAFVRDPALPYPRAIIEVASTGDGDPMSPGTRDFTWGADFRIDKDSFGSAIDNGDNLVQRGLSSHPTMFKAEVDGDRAACTVIGDEGTQIIRASERVRPGWWYRLRCQRTGDELAVFVTEYEPSGDVNTYASRVAGLIGDVTMPTPETPLTVGGKIGADGGILDNASDQFNGIVMNPVLAIGR